MGNKLDDEVGFDKKPDKYAGEEGQLETIDRMRLMCRNWAGTAGLDLTDLAHPDEMGSLNTDLLGDLMFLGFCITTEFKYDDRAGKKLGNAEEHDLQKADWYRKMAALVQGTGEDPRLAREGWKPEVTFTQLWPGQEMSAEPDIDNDAVEAEVRGWTDDGISWIARCPHCGDMHTLFESQSHFAIMHDCDICGEVTLYADRPLKEQHTDTRNTAVG